MLYPTTEVVIKNLLDEDQFKEKYGWGEVIISKTREWKEFNWKEDRLKNRREKWTSIAKHIAKLNNIINRNRELNIAIGDDNNFNPFRENNHRSTTDSSRYNPAQQMIIFEGNPSIITGWHEFAHHLFGADELTACIFSISLFKIIFPKAFAKLNWDGHMLTL